MARTEPYEGSLRPRIYYLGRVEQVLNLEESEEDHKTGFFDRFKVEWVEENNVGNPIWTEEVDVPVGQSFISQIKAEGVFKPSGGIIVDEDDLRHFVLNAEIGLFGVTTKEI